MYLWNRIVELHRNITIEPLVFLFYICASVTAYASSNVLIQKACFPDILSEPDFNQPCPDEESAQKRISDIGVWAPFLQYPLSAIVMIFLGAWSDKHGRRRKPLFVMPILGAIVTNIFVLLVVYYWNTSSEFTVAIASVLRSLGGGDICFGLATFTYISDITKEEERTMRLGIISSIVFISTPLGSVLGGILRKEVGFFHLFTASLFVNIVTLVLALMSIKNKFTSESGIKTFQGICDPRLFILSLKTAFKKRDYNRRTIVILMAALSPIFMSVFIGEPTYLFFRYKFHFDEVEFGYYSAYKSFTIFFGNLASVYICSRLIKMSDAAIGCLATFIECVYVLAMCFLAQHPWQLYLYPALDLMYGTVYTAVRAIVSKTVEVSEVAQVISILSAADSVCPVLVYPLYSLIYKHTFVTLPGAFYLLSFVLSMIMFIIFVAVIIIQRKYKNVEKIVI